MASNYWTSTQKNSWTFTKAELAEMRKSLEDEDRQLINQYPLPDRRLLNIYFCQQLNRLGKRMPVRQQALATAQVYMRRFYTKVEMRRTNPYLVMSTAFYLACKMEECPQHIRLVVGEARQFWPEVLTSDTSKLGECEFALISELNAQLVVHHPYRALAELQSAMGLNHDELVVAWSLVNDHYLTDLPLLHPPHVIAIAAAVLAVALKPTQGSGTTGSGTTTPTTSGISASAMQGALQSLGSGGNGTTSTTNGASGAAAGGLASSTSGGGVQASKMQKLITWLAESSIDIEAVVDATQELISLHEVWEGFTTVDKVCKEPLQRLIKGRGLDK